MSEACTAAKTRRRPRGGRRLRCTPRPHAHRPAAQQHHATSRRQVRMLVARPAARLKITVTSSSTLLITDGAVLGRVAQGEATNGKKLRRDHQRPGAAGAHRQPLLEPVVDEEGAASRARGDGRQQRGEPRSEVFDLDRAARHREGENQPATRHRTTARPAWRAPDRRTSSGWCWRAPTTGGGTGSTSQVQRRRAATSCTRRSRRRTTTSKSSRAPAASWSVAVC